jgi:hypothetical protein
MWAAYVADSGYDGPLVTAYAFGDAAELATSSDLPEVGDRCAVLGGDGRPLAIVRTTDKRVGPLSPTTST